MPGLFTDAEWEPLTQVPIVNLVNLAADLDICPPEEIDRLALMEACVERIVLRGEAEGLPFSKYDRDDLAALDKAMLEALGRLQGVRGRITVDRVLGAGLRVYRTYQKTRPDNPVALMLPMLLTAVARVAAAGSRP